jgi:hypothetical protein
MICHEIERLINLAFILEEHVTFPLLGKIQHDSRILWILKFGL